MSELTLSGEGVSDPITPASFQAVCVIVRDAHLGIDSQMKVHERVALGCGISTGAKLSRKVVRGNHGDRIPC